MSAQLQPYLDEAHAFARSLAEREDGIRYDLRGACALASTWLLLRLQQEGLDAEVVVSHAHCYVRARPRRRKRWLLMDPTSTQFNVEPFIAPHPPESCPWEYEILAVCDSVEEVIAVLEDAGWSWDVERIHRYVLNEEE